MTVAFSALKVPNAHARSDSARPLDTVDDIDIRHLRYFLAVARRGSVSAAADELKVSQPSLSQQIIRLERRVGFGLFERKPWGVELTSAGVAFLKGIERIPREFRAAVAAASPNRTVLKVGICIGICYPRISEVSEMIRQSIVAEGPAHDVPSVQLKSITSSSQGSCLRIGDIDLGVVRMPLTDPSLTLVPFSVEELGVVMTSGHHLAEREKITWAELHDQRLLWVDPSHAPEHSRELLTEIRGHGWDPMLEEVDDYRPELTIHALQSARHGTVALRPKSALEGYSDLQWRPIAHSPALETLAFAALAGTRNATLLERLPFETQGPALI